VFHVACISGLFISGLVVPSLEIQATWNTKHRTKTKSKYKNKITGIDPCDRQGKAVVASDMTMSDISLPSLQIYQ
jgi:hypothetical protein